MKQKTKEDEIENTQTSIAPAMIRLSKKVGT